jgi:putative oxidoreductase
MTLVRRIARPLLASTFVLSGVESFKHPARSAEAVRPTVERLAPRLGLPDDTELLVRTNGLVMVTAGTMLALGRLPRLSAALLAGTLVPTTLATHQFWREDDPEVRSTQRAGLLRDLGLLGGLLIAAVDTEGRPGLAYRAHLASESVQRSARTARREARHAAHSAAREAKLKAAQAQHALA